MASLVCAACYGAVRYVPEASAWFHVTGHPVTETIARDVTEDIGITPTRPARPVITTGIPFTPRQWARKSGQGTITIKTKRKGSLLCLCLMSR